MRSKNTARPWPLKWPRPNAQTKTRTKTLTVKIVVISVQFCILAMFSTLWNVSVQLNWIFAYFTEGNSLLYCQTFLWRQEHFYFADQCSMSSVHSIPCISSLGGKYMMCCLHDILHCAVTCLLFTTQCVVCVSGLVDVTLGWIFNGPSLPRRRTDCVCVCRQKADLCQFSQCEPRWGHLDRRPKISTVPFSC